MQASPPCTTWAAGAAARNWFIAPHSSASTCANEIQRRSPIGTIRPTASDTSGNSWRIPVWNRNGSSPRIRNWLNEKPAGGATSAMWVDSRKMSGAISSMVVCMAVSFGLPCGTSASGARTVRCDGRSAHRAIPRTHPLLTDQGSIGSVAASAAASARVRTPSLASTRLT